MRIRPVLRFMIWSKLIGGMVVDAFKNIPYWKEPIKPYIEHGIMYRELFGKRANDFRMAEVKYIKEDAQLKVYQIFKVKEKVNELAFQYRIQKHEVRAVLNGISKVIYTELTFRFRDFRIIYQILNKNDIIVSDIIFNKGVTDVSYMSNVRWIYQLIRIIGDEIYNSTAIVALDSSHDVHLSFTKRFLTKYNDCVLYMGSERESIIGLMLRELAYRDYASGMYDVSVMYAKLCICRIENEIDSTFDIKWNEQIKLK